MSGSEVAGRKSTDPQGELFDVLDAEGRPLGIRKTRGDVHRDGDWHAAMHVWVGGVGEDGPFVVFQRRSQTKDTWPGALDVAVGGHVRAGESFAETVREAEEEIGLAVTLADLVRIGRRFTGAPGDGDREVQEVFATRSDLTLEAYVLHADEVDAVVSVLLGDALALFRGEIEEIEALELLRGDGAPRRCSMRVTDFAGRDRARYATLSLERLAAVLEGRVPAAFALRDAPLGP
jgi:isopentenyldiphosphate isomerase